MMLRALLLVAAIGIVTASSQAADMRARPIGTGPFKLAEWQPTQYARLPKSSSYFVKDQPNIDEM